MKKYWLIKIHPLFIATDENTGGKIEFRNWRESLFDVFASSVELAKKTAELTGYVYGIHYHDIIEETG